jgi:hypothetical protein
MPRFSIDSSRATEVLGLVHPPIEETMRRQVDALLPLLKQR